MWDLNKPRERLHENSLLDFIQAHPDEAIFVRRIKGQEKFRLVSNFQGELCYQDGPNKRVCRIGGAFELCEESMELIDEVKRGAHQDSLKETRTRQDPETFRRGFNGFIDSVIRGEETTKQPPKKTIEKPYMAELPTNFWVLYSADLDLQDLVVKYVLGITESLISAKKSMPASAHRVGCFKTKGLIRNIPGLPEMIEKELKAVGINCSYDPPKIAYFELTAWQDNVEEKLIT